jgi:hypothetical protein
MLTSGFSSENIDKIEKQINSLPKESNELFAILAQTLRHINREAKKRFKKGEGRGIDKASRKRLDLCQRILDTLHDIGHNTNDALLISDIDRLDDCLVETEQILKRQENAELVYGLFMFVGALGVPTWAVMALIAAFRTELEEAWGVYAMFLLTIAVTAGSYWVSCKMQGRIQKGIAHVENVVGELAERRRG